MFTAVFSATILLAAVGSEGDGYPNELSAAEQAMGDFVMAGFRHGRDRVKSGVFQAKGIRGQAIFDRAKKREWTANVFCAFQFDPEPRIRFDRQSEDPAEIKALGGAWLKYIHTTAESVYWASGVVAISSPDDREFPSRVQSFDVRIMGIGTFGDLQYQSSYDDVCEALFSQRLGAVEVLPGSVFRLTWYYDRHESGQYRTKRTVWFDETQGFSPVRMETRRRSLNAMQWSEPKTTSEVTFVKFADSWVPERARIAARLPDAEEWYAWSFDWQSVNEPVADIMFTIQGLGAPGHATIVDKRKGQGVIVGKVQDQLQPGESDGDSSSRGK
jgi:hypothetical protein